jgi:hypothetical protein
MDRRYILAWWEVPSIWLRSHMKSCKWHDSRLHKSWHNALIKCLLDWPQRASNGMRPSLRPVWSRALIGGVNQLMVVGPCRAARIQKVKRGWGHTRRSSLWPISLSHITLGPITEAQRRRESSTPLRVFGSHRIRRCSSSPNQRPADLLPLHQQEPLRRLQRCRVHRTSPLVRHANPKTLSVVPLLTFRPTRCRPSRSLSTNTSVILTFFSL